MNGHEYRLKEINTQNISNIANTLEGLNKTMEQILKILQEKKEVKGAEQLNIALAKDEGINK
jgi:hypothetical protein|tara:strand:+ start:251 stop:436 length:186 start_codon:yes stop_codon:yes gene_type:complete